MQQYRKNLGKVSLTAEGAWNLNNSYDILSIVYDEHTQHGFISRKAVPQGVDLYNKEYWMPLNVSGYADNNVIILSKKTSEASIQSYTLEEAIASIKSVGRRPGAILGFYNENNNRLDIGGRWELWQFNDTNVYNWENVDSWQNLYYNYNKFMGWFKDENFLTKYAPFPEIGCYAFVGSEFNEATVYRCDNKYIWSNTTQHAWDYVKVIVDGNVTVGENGNWFNDGKDTGIPATVKGENGKTPIFREKDNTIQYSFDNVNWITISDKVAAWFRWNATTGDTQANNVGRIQISRDGVTWTNLSGNIINNLHISRYIGADETLPISGIAEGTIYAKGPTYADEDTSHSNPIYRLWVYAWKGNTLAWQDNGEFQSIAAGVVQETGDSETKVMSQDAVTKEFVSTDIKLTELEMKIVGTYIQQPSELTPDQRYIQANGNFVIGANLYSVLIPVAHLRGKHLTQNGSTGNQYAFVKSVTDANVVFAEDCTRESGMLNNTLVPSDASYLYVYLGDLTANQAGAKFVVVDGEVGVEKKVANLQTDVTNIQTDVADNLASIQSIEGNFTSVIQSVNINEDSSWKKLQGYVTNVDSDGAYIIFNSLEGYDSYYKYVEKDSHFSANAESNEYYSICYGENAGEFPSFSSSFKVNTKGAARLRKSESNLPSESNPLFIPKGSIIVVSVKTTDANTFIREKKENNAIKESLISIEATNEYSYLINLGKYQVDLMKVVSTSANSELWNMLNLRSNGIQITMGDILGVIKEQGEDDFMGGVHGDEKIVYLNIHCDGVSWDRQSKVLSNGITIDMFSNIFRVSTKEHIYNKVVHIEFKRNNIRITNTYKCLVNSSVIESAVNGGLIDCRQEILTSVVMPNYYSPIAPTTQPNNASKVNTEGTFYWINGAINVRNLQGKELDTFMGYDWLYVVNGKYQRNKIYMDLAKKNPITLNNGDELCGICEYNLL